MADKCVHSDCFKNLERFGPSLRVSRCSHDPTHVSSPFEVTCPADFGKIEKCTAACGKPLPCGHLCKEKYVFKLTLWFILLTNLTGAMRPDSTRLVKSNASRHATRRL